MPRKEIAQERLGTGHIERELARLTGEGVLSAWKRTKQWSRQRSWMIEWPDGTRRTWGAGKIAAFLHGVRQERAV